MFKHTKISTLLLLLISSLSPLIFAEDVEACSIRKRADCIPKPLKNTPFDPNTWNPVDWVKSGAGKACEANAATTAQRNIDRKQGLDPIQKQYLRPYFGNLVDEVTVKWDSLLNDNLTFQGRTVKLGSAGQTYGNIIYIADKKQPTSTEQLVLLAHEFRHVQQYRKRGNLNNFCREYMTAYAKADFSYEDNSFERDAYNFEYKFASELKSKLLRTGDYITGDEIRLTFPSYIKRSPIVLPTELTSELAITNAKEPSGITINMDTNFDGKRDIKQLYGNGKSEDEYLVGDWDGDGRDNIAVRRGLAIHMDTNFDGKHDIKQLYGNGSSEDEYLVGDWDGDGRDNIAVRRGLTIYMDTNFDGKHDIKQLYGNGSSEDEYLVGDWDGDGRDNIAVRRGLTIYMDTNFDGKHDIKQLYGNGSSEDEYLVGDWDGDGRDNIAVRRGLTIYMDTNFDGKHDIKQLYGNGSSEAEYLVGDWDGDGRDNIAVRR